MVNRIGDCSSCSAGSLRNRCILLDRSAMLRDIRNNPIDAGRNIHTIHYRIIKGIVCYLVVVEKGIRLRRRSRSQTQNDCAGEVVEYFFPPAID